MLSIPLQDPSLGYSILGVVLATATAVLGSQVLTYNYYHDHWLVLFCLVLCSCQYRLVSVLTAHNVFLPSLQGCGSGLI
jgi:hypothetical protein